MKKINSLIQIEKKGKKERKKNRVLYTRNGGFLGSSVGKESTCNVGDLGLISELGKSWKSEWLLSPEFWLGKFHGLYSPWGPKELDTTEQLLLHTSYQKQ